MGYKFNPFTGMLDIDSNLSLENPLEFKGTISVNTDFPLAADVQNGWFYIVDTDVTDDAGPTYTNTGQSFQSKDEIVWNGTDWTVLGNTKDVEYIDFELNPSVTGEEGRLFWNDDDGTLNLGMPGGDVNLQIGQEMVIRAKNAEGSQINNGQVVRISGASGQKPEVSLANASEISSDQIIAIATEDVGNNQFGYFTTVGLVRELDTSSFSAGDVLYLDTVDGGLTNTKPDFPNYTVHAAHCIYSHANQGIILVHIHPEKGDDLANFWNGSFRESFNATADSDGVTVTMSLEQSGGGDLTMQFSDGLTVLDCTPAATVELTPGSDSSPTMNYVYIPFSTKVLTVSTASFPTDEEHIKVSSFFVPSAAHVQSEGTYITHNWNDHLAGTDGQGHMSHMAERIRRDGAYYFSGLGPNGTDQSAAQSYFDFVAGNEAYFKMASGVIYQMHRHAMPAVDTSTAGDDIHVVNWNGDNYREISDLGDIVADSTGGSLSNKYFNLFFFAVGNKTGEYSPIMCMLPSGSYSSQTSAENDTSGFDNLSMPREFDLDSSTGVPICRMTLRYSGGTNNLSHISTTDLRSDGLAAGAGGTGALTSFADNQFNVYNVSDSTKIVDLDVSGVTTSTTRTLTIPDSNGTIALTNIDNAFSTTQSFADDVVLTGNNLFRRNTSDGSDSGILTLTGGGGAGTDRGAFVSIAGNEAVGVGGYISNTLGNVSGATFIVEDGLGTDLLTIDSDSVVIDVAGDIDVRAGDSGFTMDVGRGTFDSPSGTLFGLTHAADNGSVFVGGGSALNPANGGLIGVYGTNHSVYPDQLRLFGGTTTPGFISLESDTKIPSDSNKLYFGAGDDAYLTFDGDVFRLVTTDTTPNFAFGDSATGSSLLAASNNNFLFGGRAGQSITTGVDNVAMGFQALRDNTVASNNLGIGIQALQSNISSANNIGIGKQALFSATSGSNTAVGYQAGYTTTNGGNVFLGNQAGFWETNQNKLYIDDRARTDEATGRAEAIIYGEMAAAVADQNLFLNADVYLQDDNRKLFLGASDDISHYWDGTGYKIDGIPTGTVASGDKIYFEDITDSDRIKTTTAQDIVDLLDTTGFVPYTGATTNVDLGSNDLTANKLVAENTGSSVQIAVNTKNATSTGSAAFSWQSLDTEKFSLIYNQNQDKLVLAKYPPYTEVFGIDATTGQTTFNIDVKVPDEVYGAGWNGSVEVPTKNAVYDEIETRIIDGGTF